VALRPSVTLEVALYWHQWKLAGDGEAGSARGGLLDEVGAALAAGARRELAPLA
jgi:LysR family transcriptional regulator (chromosome initiation inhibitor)